MNKVNSFSQVSQALLPPLTLLLGAAGSGKTHGLRARFRDAEPGHALLTTASPSEAAYLQTQLVGETGIPLEEIKGRVQTFRHLVREWSVETLEPGAMHVTKSFQRLALLDIFRRETRPEDYFGRLLESPGFVPALVEKVREWKLAGITPPQFAEAVQNVTLDDPDAKRRLSELAKLYTTYDDLLGAFRLYDEEDALRRVREHLESGKPFPELYDNLKVLLIDGFHLLNGAQISLLRAFSETGIEVVVSLPYAPDRPELFTSVERTLETLREAFTLNITQLPSRSKGVATPLIALEQNLFRPSSVDEKPKTPVTVTGQNLLLHDAPNPYIEVEMAAREIRRMFDQGGYRWSDFAIVLRTQGDYAPILTAVFERYEIPIGIDGPEDLLENPLLKTVLSLLEVYRGGWKRNAVMAFLKSSYVGHSRLDVDRAQHAAKSKRVSGEREEWLAFSIGLPPEVRASVQRMVSLSRDIENRNEPLTHYAEWLLRVVEEFGLESRIEEGVTLRAQRDLTAWTIAKELLEAMQHLARIQGRVRFTFEQFCDGLQEAWSRTSALASLEGDCVQVLEPYETRSRPLKVVILMGLTESVFPRRILEDPFIRDSERVALRERGSIRLEQQLHRADDERLFFYFATTTPTERLILSYPRSNADSDTLPSFYLDEVRNVIPHIPVVSRTLNDVVPRPEEVVCKSDLLLSFCAEAFDPRHSQEKNSADIPPDALLLLQDCEGSPDLLAALRTAVHSRNLPPLPRLEAEDLLKKFAAHKSVFSVTELEDYRRCPFSYLLKHVFKLRPEEGAAEAQVRGTLLRKTLHRYHRERQNSGESALYQSAEEMEKGLLEIAEELLAKENPDLSPLQLRFLRRGLRDALKGVAYRESQFAPRFEMTTSHIGLTFGYPLTPESDPLSTTDALYLEPSHEGEEGGGVWLSGTIDRVDLDAGGKQALLLHYRAFAAPSLDLAEKGESLMLPLSLLAMHHLFEKEPIAACFDAAGSNGRSRIYRLGMAGTDRFRPLPGENGKNVRLRNTAQYNQMLENARTVALQIVHEIRLGKIGTKPGDYCGECAYSDVCRTDGLGEHDGEKG